MTIFYFFYGDHHHRVLSPGCQGKNPFCDHRWKSLNGAAGIDETDLALPLPRCGGLQGPSQSQQKKRKQRLF